MFCDGSSIIHFEFDVAKCHTNQLERKSYQQPRNYNFVSHTMFIYASYEMILSPMKSVFGCEPSRVPTKPRLVHIVPTILLITVADCLLDSVSAWNWVLSLGGILATMVATHFAIVVLVECTIRLILLRVGFVLLETDTTSSNADYERMQDRQKDRLDRHIQRSLMVQTQVHERTTKTTTSEPSRTSAVGSSSSFSCCSICLEELKAEDTVVSGRKNCCRSNIFHQECIHQWLRINNSCPCCRTPMLVAEPDTEAHQHTEESSDNSNEHNDDEASNVWRRLYAKLNNAIGVWNEMIADMAA